MRRSSCSTRCICYRPSHCSRSYREAVRRIVRCACYATVVCSRCTTQSHVRCSSATRTSITVHCHCCWSSNRWVNVIHYRYRLRRSYVVTARVNRRPRYRRRTHWVAARCIVGSSHTTVICSRWVTQSHVRCSSATLTSVNIHSHICWSSQRWVSIIFYSNIDYVSGSIRWVLTVSCRNGNLRSTNIRTSVSR